MSRVKFWYAMGEEKQLAFDPNDSSRTYEVVKEVPVGEGHIEYSKILMCQQSREKLKNEAKAKKHKVVQLRLHGVKLCEKCEKRYKEHPDLEWAQWINPPEPKIHKPIEFNPLLLENNNEKLHSQNP